jgi:hypothetical protein
MWAAFFGACQIADVLDFPIEDPSEGPITSIETSQCITRCRPGTKELLDTVTPESRIWAWDIDPPPPACLIEPMAPLLTQWV